MTPEEFWSIWQASETDSTPLIYRLYYGDSGQPLFYSMEDVPGNYIDIDPDLFRRAPSHVRVINGKLVELNIMVTKKLTPADTGTCCSIHDVSIVVTSDQEHTKWSLKTYE